MDSFNSDKQMTSPTGGIRSLLLPGATALILAVLVWPVFPVLAGGGWVSLATSTVDMFYGVASTPPALDPTSVLEYPPSTSERPAPYKAPLQLRAEDHFWFDRPIPSTYVNWIDTDYRYASDLNDLFEPHNGVDFPAKAKTPVIASADGIVNWVGVGLFGHFPNINDPYGMAVTIRHDFGYLGQDVFTAYAHLSQVDVSPGQRVKAGDQLGLVGATGNTTGPHLHFEVRIGEDSFYCSRNPELWLVPPIGYGVLAGRIETTDSWPLIEYPFILRRQGTYKEWKLLTYVGNVAHPDDIYQENFVVGDLPAGTYVIDAWVWWRHYYFEVDIAPGQTTFVVIHSGLDPLINPPLIG
ncbi:MAG: M23 family metallopeptidase [Anaerolineales bacterium]|nr:M23 family metallopeptidase [Anaerolineales bacterium]